MDKPHWIAADWGTSNLRLWGVDANGETLFSFVSGQGMSHLTPADYPEVLADLLADHLVADGPALPVLICGMAGARQGWAEAPYLPLPARLDGIGQAAVRPDVLDDTRFLPAILPGLCVTETGHEDVMRGEETQLLGLLDISPGFEGIVCLPGTHSKWVMIENGTVARFETAMTGELYGVLSAYSVLRHALAGDTAEPPSDDGLASGLMEGLDGPERLSANLFRTRAAALVADRPPSWCRGYLSGLLIGTEIAAHRDWRQSGKITLIGTQKLCDLYAAALAEDGAESDCIEATRAVRLGLDAARRQILEF